MYSAHFVLPTPVNSIGTSALPNAPMIVEHAPVSRPAQRRVAGLLLRLATLQITVANRLNPARQTAWVTTRQA